MIQFIQGQKGTGKTKYLIDTINEAVKQSAGNVVVIEKGDVLRYDVDHEARLIDIEDYEIEDFSVFYGFFAGLFAGNYDISDVFVDATFKIGGRDYEAFEKMIQKLDELSDNNDVRLCFTVSCTKEELPESLHKYIIAR